MADWLAGKEPILTLVGIIISVLAIAIGVVAVIVARKDKRPRWSSIGVPLVTELATSTPELRVFIGDRRVERATLTILFFWNAGKETMRGEDIASKDPLRVEADEDTSILVCDVLRRWRPIVQAGAAKADACGRRACLDFDFLDRNDGFSVGVVHTGPSPDSVGIKGTIVGAPGGVEEDTRARARQRWCIAPLFLLGTMGRMTLAVLLARSTVEDIVRTVPLAGPMSLPLSLLLGWATGLAYERLFERPLGPPRELGKFPRVYDEEADEEEDTSGDAEDA